MGLGQLLTRSTRYTATDTVTGATATFTVVDNLAPDWPSSSAYRGAMSIPGAWRASLLLSGLLARVPWHAYRKFIGKPEELIEPNPPLLEQPSPPETRLTTFRSWGLDYLWNGNAVGIWAARNREGWPTAVIPVPASMVGVRRVTQYMDSPLPVGALEYSIGSMRLGSQDVLHIKGPCEPGGLRGMGVLETHMASLSLAREQGRQAQSLANHGVPTGVIESANPDLSDDEAAQLKATWLAAQSTRTVAVLNASTKFHPLSWNPEEMQLVEARKFTLTELELVFGLPVGWLGGQTSSRTYCADIATEILTADGWRRYDKVRPGDSCLTLNTDTGLAEWQPVEAVHVYEGPHDIIRMRSLTHSSVTTADHRWPTFPQAGAGMVPRWRWRTTRQLNSGDRILAAAPLADLPTEPKWSDALVELAGWFWTEGHIEPSGAVKIAQSWKANPDHVARIRAALVVAFGPERPALRRGCAGWREFRTPRGMCHFRISPLDAATLLAVAPDKVLTIQFLRELTQAQLDLLIQVSLWADGTVTSSGAAVLAQRDPTRLEAFQIACLLAGRSGTIRRHRSGMWCMVVQRKPWRKPKAHAGYVSEDRIDEPVWCPTTGNGSWLARRDGTVYFTGNSNIEQDAVNLLKFSLGDHVEQFEQTLSLAFPRGTQARANLDAILRADTLTRYQAHRVALGEGEPFLTVDEVRDLEHRPPMPKKPRPLPFGPVSPDGEMMEGQEDGREAAAGGRRPAEDDRADGGRANGRARV